MTYQQLAAVLARRPTRKVELWHVGIRRLGACKQAVRFVRRFRDPVDAIDVAPKPFLKWAYHRIYAPAVGIELEAFNRLSIAEMRGVFKHRVERLREFVEEKAPS